MIFRSLAHKFNKIINIKDPLKDYKIYCHDEKDSEYSLGELLRQLTLNVIKLEQRIEVLEKENIELVNELYRLQNSLEARIDILASQPYNETVIAKED